MQEQTHHESPMICDLTAMDSEQRERYQALVQRLHASVQDIQEVAEGYALRFPPESSTCLMIAEFITLERLCCPFLSFRLDVEREGGPVWLRLTGREGVKAFLQAELGLG